MRRLLLLVVFAVCSCGAPVASVATPQPVSTVIAAIEPTAIPTDTAEPSPVPTVTEAPSPTVEPPTATPEPTAEPSPTPEPPTATPEPTAEPTTVPTTAPDPTAEPTVVPTTAPAPIQPVAAEERFRTVRTSDGFVSVRAQPNTTSEAVRRLSGGTEVVCAGTVAGESLAFGNRRSDQWMVCPSVGGYIFSLLLEDPAAQAAAPPPPAPAPASGGSLYRTVPTDDGFVSVRAQPNTTSALVRKLTAGTAVECTGMVAGEPLAFGGRSSNQWANCPSVGGYIFGLLVRAGDAAAAPPPTQGSGDEAAIVAALRGDSGLDITVDSICIDGNYATASVIAPGVDGALASLKRTNGTWSVITIAPAMGFHGPGGSPENFGLPADFACRR